MHGYATPRLGTHDPKAARIAELSAEYLIAKPNRQSEIGEEIAGLISGRILPMRRLDRSA